MVEKKYKVITDVLAIASSVRFHYVQDGDLESMLVSVDLAEDLFGADHPAIVQAHQNRKDILRCKIERMEKELSELRKQL